ncbi:hypothetical protein BJ322DRAFT_1008460 [Thelephora terrestris]|uniref:SNF5-domain-containing protein n=1 Tax=Thelephora terrestris TaxID=56493 RepID=A0A9P6L565_9AGAM|nr:hypothetical protein BJ322DRAFT_1008460 [Thelephora terrestris]
MVDWTDYHSNIQAWSSAATPPPKASSSRTTRRTTRSSNLANQPAQPPAIQPAQAQSYNVSYYQPPPAQPQYFPPQKPRTNPPRPVLPTTPQALHSTYASRLRTGSTLLMQPTLSSTSTALGAGDGGTRGGGGAAGRSRRSLAINYAEPPSGDEGLDAGAIDSEDSDFIASGGVRTSIRKAGRPPGGTPYGRGTPQPGASGELDQSYLGMIPPSRFITAKPVLPTAHEYFSDDKLEAQASKPAGLIPIRVEFETETHRIRDCFVWNTNELLITPEKFASVFCADLELPQRPWVETVANQIRAQIEEHEAVGTMDLSPIVDYSMAPALSAPNADMGGVIIPDCRVILSIDVQIATHHLIDHIEWDLHSHLTPEEFAIKLCADLGLSGEAPPLVAHAVHEEIIKHKRDAIEWGVLGGDYEMLNSVDGGSNLSLLKDKTGLGLGWGRTPRDGRGPKTLRSAWRDWAETEEFRTKFEVLTADEVERRDMERDRATRRLRRETSKFQTQAGRRRFR